MSSVAHSLPDRRSRPRWLLLGSLALNLFFVGIAGSMAAKYFVETPATAPDRTGDAARIERIAATLPSTDADRLRAQFAERRQAVEAARENIRAKQDSIRATLRAEPFNVEAMRSAMADTRAARENFYQVLQGVILTAATQMSTAGRGKLADWRSKPGS